LFRTCSYPEFSRLFTPDFNAGVPVQTSNGFPRFTMPYKALLLGNPALKLPQVYPARPTLNWSPDRFVPAYRDKLNEVGVDAIRAAAAKIRAAVGVSDEVPLVLLCFEQLAKKPGTWCHRTLFGAWWHANTGEEVAELGARPSPEIRADENLGLF
jgi:hypothetical protein